MWIGLVAVFTFWVGYKMGEVGGSLKNFEMRLKRDDFIDTINNIFDENGKPR